VREFCHRERSLLLRIAISALRLAEKGEAPVDTVLLFRILFNHNQTLIGK